MEEETNKINHLSGEKVMKKKVCKIEKRECHVYCHCVECRCYGFSAI